MSPDAQTILAEIRRMSAKVPALQAARARQAEADDDDVDTMSAMRRLIEDALHERSQRRRRRTPTARFQSELASLRDQVTEAVKVIKRHTDLLADMHTRLHQRPHDLDAGALDAQLDHEGLVVGEQFRTGRIARKIEAMQMAQR